VWSVVKRLWGDEMNAIKIGAIGLIVAGLLGLAYGGFSYTKETHETKIGPLELAVKDRERVNIPVWAGVAAVVAGGLMLVVPRKS
jgi:hypothetical protein